jgi:hypothetical protein
MRTALLCLALLSAAAARAADGDKGPYLLKPGGTPRAGWSVVIVKTDSVIYGGRVRIGDSETCENTDTAPCHFAVPDGPSPILVDQPLEYGDTTATITAAGGRVYTLRTGQNTGRAAARALGGLLGAMMTQPDDAAPAPGQAAAPPSGPLSPPRKGSRFDLEYVSGSEAGAAAGFVAPEPK